MTSSVESPLLECVERGKRSDIQNLRLSAALIIMVWHIWSFPLGGLVSAFFVISGYLISQGLIAQIIKNNGKVKLVKFMTTVAYRLIPPVATISIVAFPLLVMFAPMEVLRYEGARHFLSAIGLSNLNAPIASQLLAPSYNTTSLRHEWTVGVQLQAYIIMALMFFVAGYSSWKNKTRKPLLYAVAGIFVTSISLSVYIPLCGYIEACPGPNPWVVATHYTGIHSRLYQFMAGIAVALCMPEIRGIGDRFRFAPGLSLIAGVSMIPLSWWVRNLLPLSHSPGFSEILLVAGCVLILMYGVMAQERKNLTPQQAPGLVAQGLDKLGTFTFAIYLVHWPVYAIATYYFRPQEFQMVVDYEIQPGATTVSAAFMIIAITAVLSYIMKSLFEDRLIETARNGNPGFNLAITVVVAISIPASFSLYAMVVG